MPDHTIRASLIKNMHNIDPTSGEEDWYDEFISGKNNPRNRRLRDAKSRVLLMYLPYLYKTPYLEYLPESGLPNDTHIAKDLLHTFEHAKKPKQKLLSRLTKKSIKCPYCGLNDVSRRDHYVPKKRYPEYAIFTKNIIPSCSECNTDHKSDNFLDKNGKRLFFNPYFDLLPTETFLFCNIEVLENSVDTSFWVSSKNIGRYKFEVISNHFEKMNLDERYSKNSSDLTSKLRSPLRRYCRSGGTPEVRQHLLDRRDFAQQTEGSNHWRTAFLEAAAQSDEFCNLSFM